MKNIVILISGGGSNMAAIVRTAQQQDWARTLGARVAAVVSNKADAKGLAMVSDDGALQAAVEAVIAGIAPFVVANLVTLALVSYIPELSTTLPRLMGL